MATKNKDFNWRSFTSLYITFSFIIMVISGIILFFAPPGRIAHWSYWAFFGLTKTEWQNIHTIFTFLFIVAGGFHIYFNWKPLMFYLKNKTQSSIKIKSELTYAIVASLLICILTLSNVPPFSTVLDFGEYLTNSWEDESNTPPTSHAEQLNLTEFALLIDSDKKQMIQKLRSSGFSINNDDATLEEIAQENSITPSHILEVLNIKSEKPNNSSNSSGRGYGRKSVEDVCEEAGITIDEGLLRLMNKNISANKRDNIKNIALKNEMLPSDVFNIIMQIEK
ncbi:MAG: DUF4405 domain-containing protein [Ignavibacteriae bacterium]|nr:DUF4405 domain-containing protein [Ignavibacteriota bacterium]